MDLQTMQLMKQVDIRNVDKNALVDLSTLPIK